MLDGEFKVKETAISKLKDIVRRFLSTIGVEAKFNTDQDVLNFIKDYNKSISKGKLTRGQKKTIKKGIKGKLITPKTTVEKVAFTRESMKNASPEMKKLLMEQEEIFMMEGEIDANELQVREDEIAEKIAQLEEKEGTKKDVAKPKIKAKAAPKIMLTVQQAEQAYDDALDALNADFDNPALETKVDKALEELEAAEARAEAGEEVAVETTADKPKVIREKMRLPKKLHS